jgi:hypothetical protein
LGFGFGGIKFASKKCVGRNVVWRYLLVFAVGPGRRLGLQSFVAGLWSFVFGLGLGLGLDPPLSLSLPPEVASSGQQTNS